MQYRREIDGLRAVAVLPVILFHAGFSVFGGGYVGVDVFFVISGYLITTILIAELEKGGRHKFPWPHHFRPQQTRWRAAQAYERLTAISFGLAGENWAARGY